jgi:hypothetical protein
VIQQNLLTPRLARVSGAQPAHTTPRGSDHGGRGRLTSSTGARAAVTPPGWLNQAGHGSRPRAIPPFSPSAGMGRFPTHHPATDRPRSAAPSGGEVESLAVHTKIGPAVWGGRKLAGSAHKIRPHPAPFGPNVCDKAAPTSCRMSPKGHAPLTRGGIPLGYGDSGTWWGHPRVHEIPLLEDWAKSAPAGPLGCPRRARKKGTGAVRGPQKERMWPAEKGLFKLIIDSAGRLGRGP